MSNYATCSTCVHRNTDLTQCCSDNVAQCGPCDCHEHKRGVAVISKPTTNRIIELSRAMADLRAEAERLQPKVNRLAQVQKELENKNAELDELLHEADVDIEARGNAGWASRTSQLVQEIVRLADMENL